MSECDRSVGKISSVDLSKVQLTRPETPMTASRRHFEGSRPGTMEAFLGNNHEIKHVEDVILDYMRFIHLLFIKLTNQIGVFEMSTKSPLVAN